MRETSLTDSSEELYSSQNNENVGDLYSINATADIFDFPATDTFNVNKVDLSKQTSGLVAVFKALFSLIKGFFVGLFTTSFEFLGFLLTLVNYLRSKAVQTWQFISLSKDRLVSTLMWRRGLLFRPATHGGVVVMAAIAVVAGGLFTRGEIAAQDLTPQESALKSANTTQTIVPTDRPRAEVLTYTVAGGDTLSTLADKFGVSVDTIKWANAMAGEGIAPGQSLKVPPVTGVVYTVKDGDTIEKVAKAYSADTQTIVDFPFNYVDDTLSLRVGQTLYVPNGSVPAPKPAAPAARPSRASNAAVAAGSGVLSWPTAPTISQYFSWFHQGIDIARPMGTPIYAAASGTIIDAKKQTVSFGWYCIQDIGNGYTVAYAHMSDQACYVGQQVARGQYIGAVGMTGKATGPHLHFEVRRNGVGVNPLTLLP